MKPRSEVVESNLEYLIGHTLLPSLSVQVLRYFHPRVRDCEVQRDNCLQGLLYHAPRQTRSRNVVHCFQNLLLRSGFQRTGLARMFLFEQLSSQPSLRVKVLVYL